MTRSTYLRSRAVLLLATSATGLAFAAGGCGAEKSEQKPMRATPYELVSKGDLGPGTAIPAPKGPVVLTVRGAITNTNAPRNELRFDMSTLERLGVVQFRATDEIATGGTRTFKGVLLKRLLDVAGARASARTLAATALNDYGVDIPVADTDRWPVLVATRTDGRRMSVAKYGPTRVVYPYGAFRDLDPTTQDPRSIWQLKTIDVR